MPDTRAHSDFPPSSLHRLEKCPASWRLSRSLESKINEFATRGTRLHAEVAEAIRNGLSEPESPEAKACIAWLRKQVHDGDDIQAERRLSFHNFGGDELYFGTADVVIMRKDGTSLIVDWKFGFKLIESRENIQLGAYACALFQEERRNANALTRIDGAIFQPAVSDTDASIWEDIRLPEAAARISEIIGMCKTADPGIKAGDHCLHCPAGENCACPLCTSVVASLSQALARNTQPLSVQSVATATDETLSAWMEALEMAEVFGKAVKDEFANRLANAGKEGLCGWKIQNARGPLKVKDNVQLFLEMQDAIPGLTASDFVEVATVSPKKVADLAKSKADTKDKAKELEALATELCERFGERGAETRRIVRAKRD